MTIYIPEHAIIFILLCVFFVGGLLAGVVLCHQRDEFLEEPTKPTYKQLNDIARMLGFNVSIHRIKEIIARWEETKYL